MTEDALTRRSSRTWAIVTGMALGIAGCSSVPEVPREVRVPVPVPCIERPPVRPSMMSDQELLALDDYGLVVALARDRRVKQGYIVELEATLEGCR
ncbi:MAG: hypothetical protein VW362_01615 [Candidatus Nanopelagicales bacterium]